MNANMESDAGMPDQADHAAARTAGITKQAGSLVTAHAARVARGAGVRVLTAQPGKRMKRR